MNEYGENERRMETGGGADGGVNRDILRPNPAPSYTNVENTVKAGEQRAAAQEGAVPPAVAKRPEEATAAHTEKTAGPLHQEAGAVSTVQPAPRQASAPPVGVPQSGYQSQYGANASGSYYGNYYNSPYYQASPGVGHNTAGQSPQQATASQGYAQAGSPGPGAGPGASAAAGQSSLAQVSGYGGSQPPTPPYTNYGGAAMPQGGAAVAAAPQKKAGFGALRFIAVLLVAAMFGFGGGYLANSINASNKNAPVVYRSPETGTGTRTSSVEGLSLSDIAAAAGESVVSITTENIVTNPLLGGQVESGAGSGVILTADGYIITNNHVVSGADNIIVTLPEGTDAEATLVGTDPTSDVAVIKINAEGLIPAVVGDSDALAVGDLCLAIGNPMGTLGGTVTNGIISALNREVTIDSTTMNLLQMDAAVSPGNSGGGLFNANAELVGIVNAKSGGESTEGLGFAIPINTAIKVAQDLIDVGYVTGRPALGVKVIHITSAEQALQYGYGSLGVYLDEVVPGGAAEAAGLQAGDLVVSFNGVDINTTANLTNAIQKLEVGDTVNMVVGRNGERVTVQVTLGESTAS